MADVFISHAASDRSFAEVLGRELEKRGWSVSWDYQPGRGWTEDSHVRKRDAARAVMILWSRRAVANETVREDARHAVARGQVLLSVLIASVDLPDDVAPLRTFRLDDVISERERQAAATFERHPTPDPARLAKAQGFLEIEIELRVKLGRRFTLPRLATVALLTALLIAVGAGVAWWRRSHGTADDSTTAAIPQQILDARRPNLTAPRFLKPARDEDAPSSTDATLLLFVHGIFGDTVGTWSRGGEHDSLPSLLLARQEFANGFDAFAFGYPSSTIKAGSFSIPEAAKTLATEIAFHSFLTKYQRIVIVAHSMGGLVALEALTTHPEIRARVPLVVTFGTPYNGSQVAELGGRVLSNPALTDMIRRETGNSLLSSLASRWKQARSSDPSATIVVCAYEKVPLPGFGLVVAESSASALCDQAAEPIAEDHMGIIKPDGPEHQSIKVLTVALRTLKRAAPVPSENHRAVAVPTVTRTRVAGSNIVNIYSPEVERDTFRGVLSVDRTGVAKGKDFWVAIHVIADFVSTAPGSPWFFFTDCTGTTPRLMKWTPSGNIDRWSAEKRTLLDKDSHPQGARVELVAFEIDNAVSASLLEQAKGASCWGAVMPEPPTEGARRRGASGIFSIRP